MEFRQGDLDHPAIVAMLWLHFETNHALTPRHSVHVFDISRLKGKDISFWSAWEDATLLGTGALRQLDQNDGELKSMYVDKTARRCGVGARIVAQLVDVARKKGLKKLYLETGSFAYFAPARALYARCGFAECAPFGDYRADPNSVFMSREISE